MGKPARTCDLLRRAAEVYDAPGGPLAPAARSAWQGLFGSGGRWMALALAHLRGQPVPAPARRFNALGLTKYGLAGGAALLAAVPAALLGAWPLLALSVPAFYATEVQMLFLFPLVIDGSGRPFRDARRWTVRAGGTVPAMRAVLCLAAVMLFGGLFRRGFVRSWCLGCLAVCLWYEDLRTEEAA